MLPVEARTQRPGSRLWPDKDKSRPGDKSSKDKYKDKWGSSKQNRVETEENLVEKPSKSGKWNSYREDDAYYYWDSINNHVQRGAKDNSKSSLKVNARKSIMCCVMYLHHDDIQVKPINYLFFRAPKEVSIASGSARNNQICFWLFMSVFALQVNIIEHA